MRPRDAALLLLGFAGGAVVASAVLLATADGGFSAPRREAAEPGDTVPSADPEPASEVDAPRDAVSSRRDRVRTSQADGVAAPPSSTEPAGPLGPFETAEVGYLHRTLFRDAEIIPDDEVRRLVLVCLDASAEDAARLEAAARLAQQSPADLAALADRLLVGGAAPDTLRPHVLRAVARTADADSGVPTSVRSIGYDMAAPAAEWRLAAEALVRAAPAEGRAVVESRLASADPAQAVVAIGALANSRSKEMLPLLVDTIMREDLREHISPLIDAIALTKDRKWSALQMTGPPDTPVAGDLGTAWASKEQQMGEVWVELSYEQAVVPTEIRIRETLAPGAVIRVDVAGRGGAWQTVWDGRPTPGVAAPRWFTPPLRAADGAVLRVRLTLDTDGIQGWSEIDAVELVGAGGLRQWAQGATASTSYAD